MTTSVKTATGRKNVKKILIKTASGLKTVKAAFAKLDSSKIKTFSSSAWSAVNELPMGSRMRSAVVAANDKIYLYGGTTLTSNGTIVGNSSDFWSFTPSTGSWLKIEPNNDPGFSKLLNPYAVNIGDYQYYIGTKMTTTETWLMRVRDLGNNVYEYASVQVPGVSLNPHGWAFAYDSKIVVADSGGENQMRIIEPATDMSTVTVTSRINTGASDDYPGVAIWPGSDQYVIVGGERLSQGDQWTITRQALMTSTGNAVTSIPEGISQQAIAFDNDNFYTFGGMHKDGEDYIPRKALWKAPFLSRAITVDDTFPGDPTVLSSACVLNGYLYIFGGKIGLNTTVKCWSYRI